MERIGHRSAEAVRSYKRVSSHQQQRVSDILNNEKGTVMPVRELKVLVYMYKPIKVHKCLICLLNVIQLQLILLLYST